MKESDEKLPSVSIVIPAFNSEKTIDRTLEGLASLDYPQNKIEIIVVDDASTDKTAEIASARGARVIQRRTKGGCAGAKNTGVDHAGNEIVAFVDTDVLVARNWLRELVAPFKDKTVGASGGRIKNKFQKNNALEKFIEYDNYYRTRKENAKSVPGSNSAYRKGVFDVVGRMDPYLGEDPDFIYRVVSHGYKAVFAENAVVYHPFPSDISTYLRKQVYYAWQRVMIFLLHPKSRSVAFADEQTPKDIILQPIFSVTLIFSLLLALLFDPFRYISILFLLLLISSIVPFVQYVYSRDAGMVPFVFAMSFVRSFAYVVGIMQSALSFVKIKIVGVRTNDFSQHKENSTLSSPRV